MDSAPSYGDSSEAAGAELWSKLEEQAGLIGWNLVRQGAPRQLESAGWLQDRFGNEVHVLKRLDLADFRLVTYLFAEPEAFTRDVLLRVAEICWLDGLTWRLDKEPQRAEATLLLGSVQPPSRLHQDHLWYMLNVIVFSEFAVRKMLPARRDRDLAAMLERIARNWGRAANGTPGLAPRAAVTGEAFATVGIDEQSQRLVIHSLNDAQGDHCIALCSRVPEHREFCWLIPEDTDLWKDFVRLAADLSGRRAGKVEYQPIDGGPIENQVVRIIGDWSRDWSFCEQVFCDPRALDLEPRRPLFRIYRMKRQTSSWWVLQNASLCDSLWVMDEAMFEEFKDLLARWVRRIEVV